MANIGLLPVEILHQIFENLLIFEDWEDVPPLGMNPPLSLTADTKAALRAVSLTCRIFHDTLEPLFWRHVCLSTWDPSTYATRLAWPKGPTAKQLFGLLKLWHSRPDIAAHVRTISIGWPAKGPPNMSDADIAFLRRVAQEFGLRSDSDMWWRQRKNLKAVAAGLAVLLAKRATVLELFVDSPGFMRCLPSPKKTPLRLGALRHVRLRLMTPNTHRDVAPLIRLAPNVKIFNSWLQYLNRGVRGSDGSTLEYIDWKGLTSISLRHCSLKVEEVCKLVEPCHELREFALLPAPCDSERIVSALGRHAGTLRKLDINFSYFATESTSIGSLIQFTRLHDLTLSLDDIGDGELCVFHSLPPNLTRLELRRYPSQKRPEIERFAERIRSGMYPSLREVRLQAWDCGERCRGRYVNCDVDSDLAKELHGEREGCDGGKIAMELKALLVNAGVECTLLTV